MANGAPTAGMVEIEFTAGVWTDVSADVEWQLAVSLSPIGRSSPFGTTQPRTMTVTLDNARGQYTPLRQVLADGVTVNGNYPNIVPRKRIRYSYFVGATKYVRFVGNIKSWSPLMDNAFRPVMQIVAADGLDRLSRLTLAGGPPVEYLADSPTFLYSLTDPSGVFYAVDYQGGASAVVAPGATPPSFGSVGPGAGNGTGANFTGTDALTNNVISTTANRTFETWINFSSFGTIGTTIMVGSNVFSLFVDTTGFLYGQFLPNAVLQLNTWYHLVYTKATTFYQLYINGVLTLTGTDIPAFPPGELLHPLSFGNTQLTAGNASFTMGYVAHYGVVLSGARVSAHYLAGSGYQGDTIDVRLQRILALVGMTSADWNLDVGIAKIGAYPQVSKDVCNYGQDLAITEGGGSVFYAAPDGRIRFANRNFRKPGTPAMILDAVTDLDGFTYVPTLDDTNIINTVNVARNNGISTMSVQSWSNAASIVLYGVSSDDITSYATTDLDALELAQYDVVSQAIPGFRLPQISLNIATASTAGLYATMAGLEIGSHIQITNTNPAAAPTQQLNLIVEGWSETATDETVVITFDTSAADIAYPALYDTASYSSGSATLNATITAAATTLAIATVGLAFTTNAAMYPLKIKILEEVIVLNSAPSGGTSPQTFTGVTRGSDGTTKAPQTAGTALDVYPAYSYSL